VTTPTLSLTHANSIHCHFPTRDNNTVAHHHAELGFDKDWGCHCHDSCA